MHLVTTGALASLARQIGRADVDALRLHERDELDTLELRLREADGRRVWLQQRARAHLSERGEPLTRLSVARQARYLLDEAEPSPC